MTSTKPRQRIMDAALELAATGGYDALQVRAITELASVSSRTIYTYFSSLDSLLIVAVAERAGEELFTRFTQTGSRKRTAAGRVQHVIDDLSDVMTANRTLTATLLRALVSGKPDVAQHVRNFATLTQAVIASAIAPENPRAADRDAAEILERVWFSALIGWATGADSDDHMRSIMKRASARVLQNP